MIWPADAADDAIMSECDPRQLPAGTRLHWYEIRSVLGQGGFGITYRAIDNNLQHEVAIKEYFPMGIASRLDGGAVRANPQQQADYDYGLKRFIDEGRTLVRFDHPAIVRVTSVFEANATAYLVMRYERGRPLSEILEERAKLPEAELRGLVFALIDGLEQVHQAAFIHRDIKPANIYLREDGSPVLLDFGSARQALGSQTQTLTTMVSAGYAPYEQYTSAAEHQGPWTDIYAIGATLYRAASGVAPMAALDRGKAIVNGLGDYLTPLGELVGDEFSQQFVDVVNHALAFQESERPQSLAALREELTGQRSVPSKADTAASPAFVNDPEAPTVVLEATEHLPETEQTKVVTRRRGGAYRYLAIGFGALAVAIGLGFALAKLPTIGATKVVDRPLDPPVRTETPRAASDNAWRIELMRAADADVEALRLTTPTGQNAYEKYRRILASDPSNREAKEGMERIAIRYLEMARQAAKRQRWDSMFTYLAKAREVAPHNDKIRAAERRLKSVVKRAALRERQ